MSPCGITGNIITRIGMADDTHTRVVTEYPAETGFGFGCSVGNDDHSGMDTIAHAYPTAMM